MPDPPNASTVATEATDRADPTLPSYTASPVPGFRAGVFFVTIGVRIDCIVESRAAGAMNPVFSVLGGVGDRIASPRAVLRSDCRTGNAPLGCWPMSSSMSISERLQSCRRALLDRNQQHVLRFWDELDKTRRTALLDDIESIPWSVVDPLIATHVLSAP